MKSRLAKTSLLILACTTLGPAIAAGPPTQAPRLNLSHYTALAPPVTTEETGVLMWMREEEKLARDVYLKLYDLWQKPVFKAIARSEQRHFDAIGAKITLFALVDPAFPAIGQFANGDLQVTYDQLLAIGSESYVGALMAGATIEDMDIRDLQTALEATQNPALQITYRNLLEGSRNHLRAFVTRLEALGVNYTPQYIDPVLFDAVIDF
jgi:hypothetical protein